jgi:lysozyme
LPAAFTAVGATPAAAVPAAEPVKRPEPVTNFSDNGVDYIKSKEGFAANPYSDYRQTSIGYGTKARPGDAGIDTAEAEKRLREEAGKTAEFIRSNAKVPLTQNQFDALTSFGYNTGTEPLGKVIADINKGDPAAATARMQQYINAGGKPLDDLKTRRAEEIALFNGTAGEPGARPSPQTRQALAGTPAQSTGTFARLTDAVKGSPLGQLFGATPSAGAPAGPVKLFQPGQGGLAGIDFGGLPASLAALSGGPGGMAMAKTMEAYGPQLQLQQQAMELNRQTQAREQAKLLMELATPKVIGQAQTQYIDEYGQPHVTTIPQYGTYDQATNKFPPTPLPASATNASARKDMDSIPLNVSGEEFANQAKSMGYSPYHLDVAQKVASYKDDPSKLYSLKGADRVIVDRLAHRINPNYDMTRYPAVANAEKNLASGKVSTAISSIGRLFDETSQASDLVDATHNSGYENVNALAGATYRSSSEYQQAQSRLKTMLNNVVDSASAVAKGGGQGAEGDARRRAGSMNSYMAPVTLKGALATEAEVGLKNGQSNLTPYNEAHGYTADNPKYKTIMDYMTPAQQKRAIAMLGAGKIEEITGKPVGRGMESPAPGGAGHFVITVRSTDEAKSLIASGKLKSGDLFIDEHGTTRTVH